MDNLPLHAWQRMELECFHPSILTPQFDIISDVPISSQQVPFVLDGAGKLAWECRSISRSLLSLSRSLPIQETPMASTVSAVVSSKAKVSMQILTKQFGIIEEPQNRWNV
jgi:hypothetical protein